MTISKAIRASVMSLLCTSMLVATPAFAEPDAATLKQLQAMQAQIDLLQKQLKDVQSKVAAANATAKTATQEAASAKAAMEKAPKQAAAAKSDGKAASDDKKVKLTVGGFIEAAGIYRSHSESADIASNFNTGIPYPNVSTEHLSEFHGTARQSRLSLLAEGNPDANTALAAYFESDFLGAAPTANSLESNSYNPRLRQAYATLDRSDWGTHILGGQSWSLITLDKKGILPRQENIPLTIDAQYVPGFTWTRNPQIRFVQDFFDKKLWAGLSLENPQANVYNSGVNPLPANTIFSGGPGSGYSSAVSTDFAPDIIGKLAFDPGYGHYEVYGLGRFFRDRNHGSNSIIMGGGAGAGAILPIIDKKLDFQLSGLAGSGIGRYGSAQLPDATLKPDGGLSTIKEMQLLAGLIGHPDEKWDLYLYGGSERAGKKAFNSGGLGYGYGSPLYNNAGCLIEGDAASTCIANTSDITQITAGAWWKFYKGSYGMMETGLQDSYTRRNIFHGAGGAPSADENITMVSFRYYPF